MGGLERERGKLRQKEKADEGEGKEKEGQRKEIFMFVENIPQNLDQYRLKWILQKEGRVSDTYIRFRRGRGSEGRFAFVRF